jgi:starch phosphorylase
MILPKVQKPVAYFCSEFATDNNLPTYAGGLGILAGDLMNAAATNHFPMVGIGILYKGKEYIQHINGYGREEKRDSEFDHDTSFLRPTTLKGKPIIINIPSPDGEINIKVYHLRLSDTTVQFFLSTNVDGNPKKWISDMDALYRGNTNSQIRQQILLGVGGMKLLRELNIKPRIYHLNEGRPGFLIWELSKQIMENSGLSFEESWIMARKEIVYTNHTLVVAGNPIYPLSAVTYWAAPVADEIGVDVNLLIKDGLVNNDTFSITQFALNISDKQSAVSKVHAKYAKEKLPNYDWIAITNGIHLPRWQDSDFRNTSMTDAQLWNLHLLKKRELLDSVTRRTGFGYDPNKMVISWARRLAEYKQPKVIFHDLERLKRITFNEEKPVQILFSGNSHAADPNSKSLIDEVIKIFSNELKGCAIFVPNYNISLANHLTSGSDVWLNTPKGNLEACGTSGMKAISNGVLNCTVVDGWAYEVDWEGKGWTIDPNNVANNFYDLLENEIVPMYFSRNEEGLPLVWIERMKKSIELANDYSADRMLNDYSKLLYGIKK